MQSVNISFSAIDDVKDFVNAVMLYDFEADLVSGRYTVDAKSIMGIFSLDLSKPIRLDIHDDNPTELLAAIDRFILK